jgi:hypothetical protein
MACFSGCLTPGGYVLEQQRVRTLLEERLQKPENAFLRVYLDAWRDLKARTGQLSDGVFPADG